MLIVYIVKQKQTKFRGFSKFSKINYLRQIFEPSRGSREVPQKFEPDRLIRFDVYFKTNKQTPKQSIYI